MFKLAIEVCFENHFGLIHAIFLSLGSTKSGYFFLGHPVEHPNKGSVPAHVEGSVPAHVSDINSCGPDTSKAVCQPMLR